MANYDPSNDNPYARLDEREAAHKDMGELMARRIKDLEARLEKATKNRWLKEINKIKAELAHYRSRPTTTIKTMPTKHSVRPTVKMTTTVFGSDMFVDGTPTEIPTKMAAEKELNADKAAHLLEKLNNAEETEDSIMATFASIKHATLWEELNVFSIVSVALDRRFSKFLEDLHKFLMRSAELLSGSHYKYVSGHVMATKRAELDEKIRLAAEACGRVSELLAADAEAAAVAAAKAAERAEHAATRTVRATITADDPKRSEYVSLMTKFADQFGKDKTTKGKQTLVLASLASGTMPSTILTKKMRTEVTEAGLGDMLTGGRRTRKQRAASRKHRAASRKQRSLRRSSKQRAATRKH